MNLLFSVQSTQKRVEWEFDIAVDVAAGRPAPRCGSCVLIAMFDLICNTDGLVGRLGYAQLLTQWRARPHAMHLKDLAEKFRARKRAFYDEFVVVSRLNT